MAIDERVQRAIDACERPSLVFDLARIEANARAFADAGRAHGITVLFAVKACPHPRVLEVVARHVHGFDVASPAELALVEGHDGIVSVADPTGRTRISNRGIDTANTGISNTGVDLSNPGLSNPWGARAMVDVDGPGRIDELAGDVDLAIRVSASITGRDPAIGAVLDGTGHRRSRFGVDTPAEVAAIAGAANGRRVGLHVHHGPVTATSSERFVASARAAMAMAHEAGFEPAFLNLGGAWHGIADLDRAWADVRAALPDVDIVVEPGRAFTLGAGFATGHIVSGRSVGDRELRVSDLSRICHLRWSPIELVARAPHPGTGVKTLVVGATCFEEDVLGEWTVEPGALAVGERIVLREVSGYALGWNTSFGGIEVADVVLVA